MRTHSTRTHTQQQLAYTILMSSYCYICVLILYEDTQYEDTHTAAACLHSPTL